MPKDITKIDIEGRLPSKIPKGHSPHKSGTGKHQDKREKRVRTRENANDKAINEQKD
jgi:hypothetical protein